jgi:hypothetical protein
MLDLGHGAAPGGREGFHIHDFVAIANATQALHAAIHLRFDQRAEIFFLENAFGFGESAARGRILMGKILQIAAAALVANRTIEGMIRDVAVRTLIPSSTGVLHAVCSLGIFSISTKHMRQFASGFSFGW